MHQAKCVNETRILAGWLVLHADLPCCPAGLPCGPRSMSVRIFGYKFIYLILLIFWVMRKLALGSGPTLFGAVLPSIQMRAYLQRLGRTATDFW